MNARIKKEQHELHTRGDALRAQGDLAAALKSYQTALANAERLARVDQGNADWQRDLAFSHSQMAQYGDQPRFHWQQLVSILKELEKHDRLAPADHAMLQAAEKTSPLRSDIAISL